MLERLGIADELAERRKQFARYAYVAPEDRPVKDDPIQLHRIEVDLKAGTRTVSVETIAPPPKPPVKETKAISQKRLLAQMQADRRPIMVAVSTIYSVGVGDLLSASRHRRVAYPRFALIHLMRKRLGLSTPQIGKAIGNRDHTSIMHALARAEELLVEDRVWAALYHAAESLLDGPQ